MMKKGMPIAAVLALLSICSIADAAGLAGFRCGTKEEAETAAKAIIAATPRDRLHWDQVASRAVPYCSQGRSDKRGPLAVTVEELAPIGDPLFTVEKEDHQWGIEVYAAKDEQGQPVFILMPKVH